MLAKAGLADAKTRGRQIWVLFEGVIALAMIHGDKGYCAEDAALALIRP